MEQNLLEILENPGSRDIEEIKSALDANPWFSYLRIIWLYRIQKEKTSVFSEELKKHIPFVRDRKQLHQLITSKSWEEFQAEVTNSVQLNFFTFRDDVSNQAEELLEIEKDELIDHPSKIEKTEANQNTYLPNPDNAHTDDNSSEPDTKKTEEKDLIERFLELDPGPIRADKETKLQGDISTESTRESEEFITDTLAKIYIKQGLYSKAIFAYEKLSLKYPEKSTYFASQIEEIKKRIDN